MAKLNFTILLTLYNRHEDTKYWLEENIFEDINYFAADGSLYNHNQKLFKELKYKNVTYKRFAYDASTVDYLNKLKKSLSEIKTKYVMINDNDDFLVKDGVKQIVSFLNDNSEYNICSGKIFYIQKSLKFINKYYFNLNSLNNYGYKDYSFNESLKRYLSKLNGWYGDKKYYYVEKFEREFAEYHGRKYGLMTPNCTLATHLLLTALGIKKGDSVINQDSTWVAPAAAVSYTGAKNIFCDNNLENWCLVH